MHDKIDDADTLLALDELRALFIELGFGDPAQGSEKCGPVLAHEEQSE